MTGFDNRLNACWWALKIGLGVGPIIIGLDKYFNKLTDWRMYLSPFATVIHRHVLRPCDARRGDLVGAFVLAIDGGARVPNGTRCCYLASIAAC